MGSNEPDCPKSNNNNDSTVSLDSEGMDANLVLFGCNQVNIPIPNAKVYNNLAEYYNKTFAKKNEKKLDQSSSLTEPGSSRFVNFKFKQNDPNTFVYKRPQKVITNVVEKMQQATGPSSILYRSIGKQIKIFVRRCKMKVLREERFSWINGQLIAFDKHMNLAMFNVTEEYRLKSTTAGRENGILVIRKFSKQLFIRGDNIVLVNILLES